MLPADARICRTRFEPLLAGIDRSDLSHIRNPTCGVFADDGLPIGYVNSAWTEFGRANGAEVVWGPGDRLLDAISEPLRTFYAERFARVLADRQPWEQDYECPSAALRRLFRMRVLAIADGAGLLITHTLRIEVPQDEQAHAFILNQYVAATGFITQCAHCRRLRRVSTPRTWDWVPALLAQPTPHVSHGLCELCSAYYFGPAALGA